MKKQFTLTLNALWSSYEREKYFCYGLAEVYYPGKGWNSDNIYKSSEKLADWQVIEMLETVKAKGATHIAFILRSKKYPDNIKPEPDFSIKELLTYKKQTA